MTDDKENRQGQGGGPKTVLGKVSSSKNAIKHGITSQKLLNPAEEKQYQEALAEFSRAYNIQHPLNWLTDQAHRTDPDPAATHSKTDGRAIPKKSAQ